eukprot:454096-Prymnesium_polylepis.1
MHPEHPALHLRAPVPHPDSAPPLALCDSASCLCPHFGTEKRPPPAEPRRLRAGQEEVRPTNVGKLVDAAARRKV